MVHRSEPGGSVDMGFCTMVFIHFPGVGQTGGVTIDTLAECLLLFPPLLGMCIF